MRVALISSEYAGLPNSGGIGTYFHNLAGCLTKLGAEVEVFTSGEASDLRSVEGVTFHHAGDPASPLFGYRVAEAFGRVHLERPIDVLEYGELKAEGFWAARGCPDVARVVRLHSPSIILDRYLDFSPGPLSRVKSVFRQIRCAAGAARRGLPIRPINIEPFFFPWDDGRDTAERRAALDADLVVVMNGKMRQFAEGHWWVKPDAIMQIPNPLLPGSHFKNTSRNRSPGPRKIGFLGRLEPRKGVLELAKALRLILPSCPDWTVEFAGRPMPSCLSGTDPANVVGRHLRPFVNQVRFLDNLPADEAADWLQGLDIFVFPSLWDNFPYVILEAMACGKPIVATRTGAVPEMLGDCGLLVPVGSVAHLAGSIRKLISDDRLRRDLGCKARARFETEFDWKKVGAQIFRGYELAVQRKIRRLQSGCSETR